MVHPHILPLSAVSLSEAEESGHFIPNRSRRHHAAASDLVPSPQSVRYVYPSMSSRPYRHMAF